MTDFSPHAVLRHPSISDEEVWNLIRLSLSYSKREGPVVLLIEPRCKTLKERLSSQSSWPVLGKSVTRTSRYSRTNSAI